MNWCLLQLGWGAQWLWHELKHVLGTLWHWIDAALNPVLARVLALLNPPCTWAGDAVYHLLGGPPWVGLLVLSIVLGTLMLVVFHYTSNQAAIGRARDAITANLLALKFYKDDLRVVLRSQGRILAALGRLQWHMLRPVFIMLLPMLLVLGQMGLRYQWRPLHPGETALVQVSLTDGAKLDAPPTLQIDGGAAIEVGPLRGTRDYAWRIRATQPGRHTLTVAIGDQTLRKELVVGETPQRVSAARIGYDWTAQVMHPAEPVLSPATGVRELTISYPGVASYLYGSGWWLLWFFVLSMLTALALIPVFKTRI